MTDHAIIAGSLVDIRNIGAHKSVKLTVHVPEEYAMKVMEAFGWPTGVSPIPVAIARLKPEAARAGSSKGKTPDFESGNEGSTPSPAAKKSWHEMSLAQQAGVLCGNAMFRKFIQCQTEEAAIATVRAKCGVGSRKDILPDTPAGEAWKTLVSNYRAWVQEPGVVP